MVGAERDALPNHRAMDRSGRLPLRSISVRVGCLPLSLLGHQRAFAASSVSLSLQEIAFYSHLKVPRQSASITN
jgi:hypothetical protein